MGLGSEREAGTCLVREGEDKNVYYLLEKSRKWNSSLFMAGH